MSNEERAAPVAALIASGQIHFTPDYRAIEALLDEIMSKALITDTEANGVRTRTYEFPEPTIGEVGNVESAQQLDEPYERTFRLKGSPRRFEINKEDT